MRCKGDLEKRSVVGCVDLFFINLEELGFQFVPVCTFSTINDNLRDTGGGELPSGLFYKPSQLTLFFNSLDAVPVFGRECLQELFTVLSMFFFGFPVGLFGFAKLVSETLYIYC